ncbi:hypothetical protein, partial [uncultured Oscillibacter sp.]|uniref:hypothetical protein n=1 Tax=uncultured Oscillibacter sp. TaxID=876091 RepID=UPI0028039910
MSKILCAAAHGLSSLLYRLKAKMQGGFFPFPAGISPAQKESRPNGRLSDVAGRCLLRGLDSLDGLDQHGGDL